MPNVLILGASGMLGSMVTRVLSQSPELRVIATVRAQTPTGGSLRHFDVRSDDIGPLLDAEHYDWIVNAIGVIKSRIDVRTSSSVENAIAVNALFPHRLAAECARRGQRMIQIATDGVFSGAGGPYDEAACHDALDVYGKTKSLGEVPLENVVQLRCSIIGPELGVPASLLARILSSPRGAQLDGYAQHRWNGVTTLHFAKLCAAIIGGTKVCSLQHVIPADTVSKAELLELSLSAFGREDVGVQRVSGPTAPVDRTLTTRNPGANLRLWRAANYERPPAIAEMLRELAEYETRVARTAR